MPSSGRNRRGPAEFIPLDNGSGQAQCCVDDVAGLFPSEAGFPFVGPCLAIPGISQCSSAERGQPD
jgi:hypothetical protein